jgi:enediyne biosynthesis protein E4
MMTIPGIDFSDVNNWPDIGDRSWSGFQRKRFFHNRGDATFQEIAATAGLNNDRDGRGIGVIDIDNDGRLDLVQTNANQAPMLYHNVSQNVGNWVELKLIGTKSNRDGIGARVLLQAGGLTLIREFDGGNGYAGQSSRRVHFGIGRASKIDHLSVRWPSGHMDQVNVTINRVSYIEEGRGVVR